MTAIWENSVTMPQQDVLFASTGIERTSELWTVSDDVITANRALAMRLLELSLSEEKFWFSEVLAKYPQGIHIVSQEIINYWSFVKIVSSEGDTFICKLDDIKDNNIIDPLDIFVVKEVSEKGNLFWSIVIDSRDSDVKVRIEDGSIDRLVHWNHWWYADSLTLKWFQAFHSFSHPPFAYCRIRDLYIGAVPKYTLKP